jgi:hypothetical protein
MSCDEVRNALREFNGCVETEEGSRVTTHCLYPSFETVDVFVAKLGTGYRVHDSGGAARVAWTHGRDYPLIKKMISRQALRFCIGVSDSGDTLIAEAKTAEWLTSAILAVANASASAAHSAIERMVAATEALLSDRIYDTLSKTVGAPAITKEFEIAGKSGKHHRFDFAVSAPNELILIDAVAPHHISISAKYVAFADVTNRIDRKLEKFAVHDRRLEPDDESLMSQVALLVPIASLGMGLEKELKLKV